MNLMRQSLTAIVLVATACSLVLGGCSNSQTTSEVNENQIQSSQHESHSTPTFNVTFDSMLFTYRGGEITLTSNVESLAAAAEGCEYLLVNYSITNNANNAETPPLWAKMVITTPSGKVYSPDQDAFAMAVAMENMRSEIQPAMKRECFTPFLLPLSVLQSEPMTLILPCETCMMEVPLQFKDNRIEIGVARQQVNESASPKSSPATESKPTADEALTPNQQPDTEEISETGSATGSDSE